MPKAESSRGGFWGQIQQEYERLSSLDQLEEQAKRQEVLQRIAEARARVKQELAIARRLEIAESVEIEEFYDIRESMGANLNADVRKLNMGMNGMSGRVVKRVYKLRGWKPGHALDVVAGSPSAREQE